MVDCKRSVDCLTKYGILPNFSKYICIKGKCLCTNPRSNYILYGILIIISIVCIYLYVNKQPISESEKKN